MVHGPPARVSVDPKLGSKVPLMTKGKLEFTLNVKSASGGSSCRSNTTLAQQVVALEI